MTEQGHIAMEYMLLHPAALGRKLGYTRLLDDLHGAWMRDMLSCEGDMTLQAHRDSYKTTCLCIALAVMLATQPDKTIMFLRKTDADVVEVIRQVTRILAHPEFQRLTAWLYARDERTTRLAAGDRSGKCHRDHHRRLCGATRGCAAAGYRSGWQPDGQARGYHHHGRHRQREGPAESGGAGADESHLHGAAEYSQPRRQDALFNSEAGKELEEVVGEALKQGFDA